MQVREYLLGITAVALVCGIVKMLLPEKGTFGTVIKLISGVLMLLVAIKPLVGLSGDALFAWTDEISADAQSIVADAEISSKEAIRVRIKEQAEAYILAKAESMGAEIEVSVTLSEESMAVPIGVRIEGSISPYAKQVMTQTIANDLGIEKGAQQWIG